MRVRRGLSGLALLSVLSGCLVPNQEVVDSLGALAKFCNVLTHAGIATHLRLEIGDSASKVSIEADTDECLPFVGTACTSIPTGNAVPIALFDRDTNQRLYAGTLKITAHQAWVFWADISSGADATPLVQADIQPSGSDCQTKDYSDLL
jgi:hypothetical protein